MSPKPPMPPFTAETAAQKARMAEDAWNTRDPDRVVLVYNNRIAVRFAHEWHDDSGQWYRSYGNENWEFNPDGYMQKRFASINEMPIKPEERKYHWQLGRRPDEHPSLSELGL